MIERLPTIEVDTSRRPLFVARFRGGDSDDDVQGFLVQLSAIVHKPYAFVSVTPTRFSFVESRHAQMYVEWLTTHETQLRRNCAGVAMVMPSAVARGAFKAIAAMAPIPFVVEQARTEAEAIAWAQARLRTHRNSRPELAL